MKKHYVVILVFACTIYYAATSDVQHSGYEAEARMRERSHNRNAVNISEGVEKQKQPFLSTVSGSLSTGQAGYLHDVAHIQNNVESQQNILQPQRQLRQIIPSGANASGLGNFCEFLSHHLTHPLQMNPGSFGGNTNMQAVPSVPVNSFIPNTWPFMGIFPSVIPAPAVPAVPALPPVPANPAGSAYLLPRSSIPLVPHFNQPLAVYFVAPQLYEIGSMDSAHPNLHTDAFRNQRTLNRNNQK